MRLRTLIPLGLLAAVVAAAIVLPGTPAVRGAVVDRLVAAADDAGYAVRVGGSRGNLWRGVTLDEVAVAGRGADVTAERVRVRYFLPPLLAGELPVGLEIEGLDGEVDVHELTEELLTPEPGAGPPLVRVRVQDVQVTRSRLEVADVPFTLPDVAIDALQVTTEGDALEAALVLVTAEGRAELVVRTRLGSNAVDIDVVAADATLGRHWWEGVTGGRGHGVVRVRQGVVEGDLRLEDGSLTALGVDVGGIAGPVTWRGATIEAELTGRALGGELRASGTVDAAARGWRATGSADARLAPVVEALWELGAPGAPLAAEGAVRATVRAEGWVTARVEVDAVADGTALGEPLEGLAAAVVYDSLDGLRVDADGGWAGGTVAALVRSARGEHEVEASVVGARWAGATIEAAEVDVLLGEQAEGGGRIVGSWPSPIGRVAFESDLTLDADGAALFVHGEADAASFEGAVVAPSLAGDAPLDGAVQIVTPAGWWRSDGEAPPGIGVEIGGQLGAPSIALLVAAPAPVIAATPWLEAAVDLRGTLTAAYDDGAWSLGGALGPLGLGGGLGGGRSMTLEADLLPLRGAARADVSDLRAALAPTAGGWLLEADADLGPVELALPGAEAHVSPLGRVRLESDGERTILRDEADRLDVLLAPDEGRASVDGIELSLGELQLALAGDARRQEDGVWTARAAATGPGVDARLEAADGALEAEATVAANAPLGAWRPGVDLRAVATLDAGRWSLEADAGSLRASAGATFDEGAAEWEATVIDGDGRVEAAGRGDAWTARGSLPLEGLLALVGGAPTVDGTVAVDLAAVAGEPPSGTLRADLVEPAPLTALVSVADGRARVSAEGELFGEALEARGDVWPTVDATLAWGQVGPIRLASDEASGSGTLPALEFGALSLPALPWSLDVDLAAASARLRVGDSEAHASWDGPPTVDVDVDATPLLAGAPARTTGTATWSTERPQGSVALRLDAPAHDLVATLEGDLDAARLAARTSAAAVAEALDAPLEARGTIEVEGSVSLLAAQADLRAAWEAEGSSLVADVALADGAWRASVDGPGLRADASAEGWTITADVFEPGAWLAEPRISGSLSGDLGLERGAWSGELRAELDTPARASGALRGVDGDLHVEARVAGNGYEADVAGVWGEEPRFQLTATAADPSGTIPGGARASGVLESVAGAWVAHGVLEAPGGEVGPLAWPAVEAAWRWEDGALRIEGGGGALALVGGDDLGGMWQLPVEIGGLPHTLRIDLGSSPIATLDGPSLRLDLRDDDGAWRLTGTVERLDEWELGGEPWAPWAAPLGPLGLEATARPDSGSWAWEAAASAPLRVGDAAPVPLALDARGHGATGAGSLAIGAPEAPAAVVRAALEDGTIALAVDGEEVDVAALGDVLGLPVSGSLVGSAALRLDPSGAPHEVVGDLRADLDYAGTPVAIDARSAAAGAWSLRAATPDGTWTAEVAAMDRASLADSGAVVSIEGPETSVRGRLLLDAGDLRLRLGGSAAGRPASLTMAADAGSGALSAAWGASRIEVDLGAERLAARANLARSDAPGGPWSLALDVDRGDSWAVERLALGGGDLRLEASGESWPTDLRGDASWGDLSEPVRLRRVDDAWRADVGDLVLHLLGDGRVVADGAIDVRREDLHLSVEPRALSWHAAEGWAGGASAALEVPSMDLAAAVVLAADGTLRATVSVGRGGIPLGGGWLEIPANLGGELGGELDLELVASGEASPDATEDWRLALEGTLFGTLGAPRLETDLVLDGPVTARGRAHADPAGVRAFLVGEHLVASARLDGAGWRAQARVRDADVGAFIPWLPQARLDLAVEAHVSDAGLEVVADTLHLRGERSSVTGSGRLAPGGELRLTLDAAVDLSDLSVGTDLAGRLEGPLTLRHDLGAPVTGAELTGMLRVSGVTVAGVPGTYGGELLVAGPAGDPRLLATLAAGGDAVGTLRAEVRPRRGSGRLDADLEIGDLRATLRATLGPDGVDGGGRIAYDGMSLRLDGAGDGVRLSGEDGLAGWSGTLRADPWRLELDVDLAATPGAEGTVEARLAWQAGDGAWPTLDGGWSGVSVGSLALPDAVLDTGDDGVWRALGDGLTATVSPALAWSIDLAGATLDVAGEPLDLALAATGTTAVASADATLRGEWQGAEVDLEARGSYDGRLAAHASGALLGGELALDLAREGAGGLAGVGSLVGAELAGGALEASVTISGSTERPTGVVEARWGPELVRARATLRDGRLEADADLGAALGDLRVSGALWPDLDVTLVGPAAAGEGAAAAGDAAAPAHDGPGTLRLHGSWTGPGEIRAEGALGIEVGGLRIDVAPGEGGAPRVLASSPWIAGTALAAQLPSAPVSEVVTSVLEEGVTFEATGDGSGRLRIERASGAWGLELEALSLPLGGSRVHASGRLEPGAGRLDVTLDVNADTGVVIVHGLPTSTPLDGVLTLEGTTLRLEAAAPWSVVAEVDLAARTARLDADLALAGPSGAGGLSGGLELDPDAGLRGTLRLANVHVGHPAAPGSVRLDGSVRGLGGSLQLNLSAGARRSSVSVGGSLPLGFLADAGWGSAPEGEAELSARVAALDLGDLPWLVDVAPHVRGVVTGAAVARQGQLIGQLVAEELTLAETTLPATLTMAGNEEGLDLRLETGTRREGVFTLSWRDGVVDALARLERFPLHAVVESIVGGSDVSALVTGVARTGWDPSRADAIDLRVATEEIRLERAGVVTVGNVSFELAEGALVIREASFVGRGSWSARGEIRPDRLDLEVVAEEADFGPLLGLVPAFARYGVAAEGNLEIVGRGSLADPELRARSDGLRVGVAGSSYLVDDASVDLVGEDLTIDAVVRGVAPLDGEVRLAGDGVVRLAPFDLVRADVRAQGDLDVPVLGRAEGVDAWVRARSGEAPTLEVDALVGAPLRIEGTLSPFDVRGSGRGLSVTVPQVFVAEATVDADLRVRVDDGIVVSGRVDVAQARLDLAARAAAAVGDDAAPTEPRDDAGRRAALRLVRFDGVRIVAPQRVTLSETIGTAEASVDLTLTGDGADPRLDGTVSALRGTFRFSGRDFELLRGVARFEPTRGVFPVLEVDARAQFEKARVTPPGGDIRFAAPSGPRFEVRLRFEAEVSPTGPGGAVEVDLVPQLSSDALVEVAAGPDGITAGTRPLSELELLSLIALGQIDVGAAGTGDVATSVAQLALDTAVDLLVVAELQAALSEALGLDVVEIRTTALSDLFGGRTDPFSVSLRFGGYLSDELFASYRVGTFDDAAREFAVTNEFAFTYELGPVAFDLAGRIDFPSAEASAPVPSLAAAVRYDVSRSFAFEAGLDVGSESQTARFGVTIRW